MNFLKQIGRMFVSLRSISHKGFNRITKGASSAVKLSAQTVGTIIAALVVLAYVTFAVIVAIPTVVYEDAKRTTKEPASATEQPEPPKPSHLHVQPDLS